MDNADLRALSALRDLLNPLDNETRERVLRWTMEHYGVRVAAASPAAATATIDAESDVADLFAAATPTTEAHKLLVVAYWRQVIAGDVDLDAQYLNTQLKQLGHGLSNVTRSFGTLMNQRPQLAMQVRKSGKSQQARKRYRLTAEGIRRAQALMARSANGE